MSAPATFLEALVAALHRAGSYNRNDQVAPAAVLWTDRERQWEPLLPRLRERLPLLTLGPYQPERRTGPAYWIRCMVARTLEEDRLPLEGTPVIYLPGISRQEMRAVEECSRELQPLVEYLYRGCSGPRRTAGIGRSRPFSRVRMEGSASGWALTTPPGRRCCGRC